MPGADFSIEASTANTRFLIRSPMMARLGRNKNGTFVVAPTLLGTINQAPQIMACDAALQAHSIKARPY